MGSALAFISETDGRRDSHAGQPPISPCAELRAGRLRTGCIPHGEPSRPGGVSRRSAP